MGGKVWLSGPFSLCTLRARAGPSAPPTTGGTNADPEAGRSTDDAGPSVGDLGLDSDTDSLGTGEHLTAGRETAVRVNQDVDVDRVVGPNEAGLGGGLDQAEEARLGVTDEDVDAHLDDER
jgi:hypothetical protein